jgi:uncharacterized phage protein (TIGR02218 family)
MTITPFVEVQFPPKISAGAKGGPTFLTTVTALASGSEKRNVNWSRERARYDISTGLREAADFIAYQKFFYARMGRAVGFRFKDWADYRCPYWRSTPGDIDALPTLFTTTGALATFQLTKTYGDAGATFTRTIKKIVAGSMKLYNNGVLMVLGSGGSEYLLNVNTGVVTLGATLTATTGRLITGSYEFDVPARSADAALGIDNLEVTGLFDSDTLTNDDMRGGKFDFAEVHVFQVNWNDLTQGIMRLRRGFLGEISAMPSGVFHGELRGLVQRLVAKVGDLYTAECRADLGDTKCALDLTSFTITATILAVTDARQFTLTGFVEARAVDGWFDGGVLTWLTGANSGRSMEIKGWVASGAHLTLFLPMHGAVLAGDTCRLYPGCDKRLATCRDKFNNIVNRRAEDYIPGLDAILKTPFAKVS